MTEIKKRNKLGLYTVDGEPYRSVTTIIRFMGAPQSLIYWYGKYGTAEANRLTEAHANYGKEVHKACDEAIFKGRDCMDSEYASRIAAVTAWIEQQGFTPVGGEQTVYNPDLHYAGTVDGILKASDSTIIIDFKTRREHRFEEALQLAAYANCPMVQATSAYIIRMGKTAQYLPEYTLYTKEELATAFEMFKKMLELYNYKKTLSKKRKLKETKNES